MCNTTRRMKDEGLEQQQEETMGYDDEVRAGQNWKNCGVCNVDYLDECPSCNPKHLYHVTVGIPNGPDDFEMMECECGDCSEFFDKNDAIRHAKSLITRGEEAVGVDDENGRQVWSN